MMYNSSMPQSELCRLIDGARAQILDQLELSAREKSVIEEEALAIFDEWFHKARLRRWSESGMSAKALPALFAVLLYCTDAATKDKDSSNAAAE